MMSNQFLKYHPCQQTNHEALPSLSLVCVWCFAHQFCPPCQIRHQTKTSSVCLVDQQLHPPSTCWCFQLAYCSQWQELQSSGRALSASHHAPWCYQLKLGTWYRNLTCLSLANVRSYEYFPWCLALPCEDHEQPTLSWLWFPFQFSHGFSSLPSGNHFRFFWFVIWEFG